MRAAAAPVVVVAMADVSDDFSRLDEMVRRAEAGADVVCASRYMKGGRRIGGPWFKAFLSRAAGVTLHQLSGLPTHDPTNSFKAYRRDFLQQTPIESRAGFALALELTVKAHFLRRPRRRSARRPGTGARRARAGSVCSPGCRTTLHWYFWALARRFGRRRPR